MLKIWNWQRLENLLPARVYWSCIPVSTKASCFPLGKFPIQVELRGWWWWSTGSVKNKHHEWRLQTNKQKWTLSVSDSENESGDFPRVIVIESLEDNCLTNFSLLPQEKVTKARAKPKTLRKSRDGNVLVELNSCRQAENMKSFHSKKCRAYQDDILNPSKRIIRNKELVLVSVEMSAGKTWSYKY